jgi:hypothetical protein
MRKSGLLVSSTDVSAPHFGIRQEALKTAEQARQKMVRRWNAKLAFVEFNVGSIVGIPIDSATRKRLKTMGISVVPAIVTDVKTIGDGPSNRRYHLRCGFFFGRALIIWPFERSERFMEHLTLYFVPGN